MYCLILDPPNSCVSVIRRTYVAGRFNLALYPIQYRHTTTNPYWTNLSDALSYCVPVMLNDRG